MRSRLGNKDVSNFIFLLFPFYLPRIFKDGAHRSKTEFMLGHGSGVNFASAHRHTSAAPPPACFHQHTSAAPPPACFNQHTSAAPPPACFHQHTSAAPPPACFHQHTSAAPPPACFHSLENDLLPSQTWYLHDRLLDSRPGESKTENAKHRCSCNPSLRTTQCRRLTLTVNTRTVAQHT